MAGIVELQRQLDEATRDVLTLEQFAAEVGYSFASIRKWVSGGRLAFVWVGNQRRIPRSELSRFDRRHKWRRAPLRGSPAMAAV